MKRIDIRPYDGVLYFTTSKEEYLEKRLKFPEANEARVRDLLSSCDGIASDTQNCALHLVGVFDKKQSTLSHEISHVVFKVLESCSIPISRANSEVFCYLLQDLVEECQSEFLV